MAGLLAERARFELAIRFWRTHAFQACLFSHSSISPETVRLNGTANVRLFSEITKIYVKKAKAYV